MTTLVTPDIPEAALLLRDADIQFKNPENLDDAKALAKLDHRLGPKAVLLKGGHLPLTKMYSKARRNEKPDLIVDILYDGAEFTCVESKFLDSKNSHGAGCSLASSVAANLASGQAMAAAVRNACRYIAAGIKTNEDLDSGSGPINHFHSLQRLSFASGFFVEYLLDRPDVRQTWQDFTHHDFVQKIGDGSQPLEIFKTYLIQDYLYLIHFARANALASYKSSSISSISASAKIVSHIEREMGLHIAYCRQFGLSQADLERQNESLACVAYSRYVLDVGQSEDWLALQMALAPCLIGYGVAAQRLYGDAKSVREGNPYWKWVENYVAEDYQEAVKIGTGKLFILIGLRNIPSHSDPVHCRFARNAYREAIA